MKKYLINSSVAIVALWVIFAGIATLSVVVGGSTWDEISDWLLKAALVAAVIIAVNAVVAGIATIFKR